MGRRGRRRGHRTLSAPESTYSDPEGNELVLRGALSPASRRKYAEIAGGSPLSQEDAWHRATEFLFERLTLSWTISGLPIQAPSELLGRYRLATQEERAWVRDVLRRHVEEHFPDVQAP
jgi:hypothetical protein